MQKHFVRFRSPGTMFDEVTTQEIDSWDIDEAKERARHVKERYGATPYAFEFITRARSEDELDSKVVDRSPTYFLGGRVLTVDDVKRELPGEEILISNMEVNGWESLILIQMIHSPWRVCQPFEEGDVQLDFDHSSAAHQSSE